MLTRAKELAFNALQHVQQGRAYLAYEPNLLPSPGQMRTEGVTSLEEWFRWSEEWSLLLRLFGGLKPHDSILEVGCGYGRVAFPLRFLLDSNGRYFGFDLSRNKISFLQDNFTPRYPSFQFTYSDIRNTFYNPGGQTAATDYRFPHEDASLDLVFAASVFTHMTPENMAHYISETARVLKRDGRALFSFFLLQNYRPGAERPRGFSREDFNFDFGLDEFDSRFAVSRPSNPEYMTAYDMELVAETAEAVGLSAEQVSPGLWSGTAETTMSTQDMVLLRKQR